jgi:hypothetical protein
VAEKEGRIRLLLGIKPGFVKTSEEGMYGGQKRGPSSALIGLDMSRKVYAILLLLLKVLLLLLLLLESVCNLP